LKNFRGRTGKCTLPYPGRAAALAHIEFEREIEVLKIEESALRLR